jgi:hypothetical protein
MKFNIPLNKSIQFSQSLFNLISENIDDLGYENEKLPNQIIFTGPLGKEVHSFILENNWNFKNFKLEYLDSPLSSIIFKYTSPLIRKEKNYGTSFEGGSLHGKEINGIPGEGTISKIIGAYSNMNFEKEITSRPEKRIILTRL